jgi:hypothetical protein
MVKVILIPEGERCGTCDYVVDFMGALYCPFLREERARSSGCSVDAESDEEFVLSHDKYEELLSEKVDLEEKVSELEDEVEGMKLEKEKGKWA